jgi:hypothetical protein
VTDYIDRSDELREMYAEDHPDGAELLDDIEAFLARFVVYPSEHERRAHSCHPNRARESLGHLRLPSRWYRILSTR